MAPAMFWPIQRDEGSNDDGNEGKGSGNSNTPKFSPSKFPQSSPPKSSPPPQFPPFKVITREVTVTSTAVQTSVVVVSSSVLISSSSSPAFTQLPTSINSQLATPTYLSAATSLLSSAPASLPSAADLDSPTEDDGSPSPGHMGLKTPLPLASVISIILGCLFFITLCLVIYVRNPRLSRRVSDMLRGRRHPTPTLRTISSFEPREFKHMDYLQMANFRRPPPSFAVGPEFYRAPDQMVVSAMVLSPPLSGGLIKTTSEENDPYKSQDLYTQEGHTRELSMDSRSSTEIPHSRNSRTISVFDEYPFEHDVVDPTPDQYEHEHEHEHDGPTAVERTSGFPQSVHDMTVE